jgi:Glycosyl hydrolases family 16
LLVEADQEPWCPEFDGDVRVSAFQTGTLDGQHRFAPRLEVRERQAPQALHLPQYGWIEMRARVTDDPQAMCALWLIGYEDEPERSGEICVCEIFGRDVGRDRALVGVGVHPFGDPSLDDEFEQVPVAIDAREPHAYAVNWTEDCVEFFVDGSHVKTVEQSPSYPMQLMLTLYAFNRTGPHPKVFDVDYVKSMPAMRRRASQTPKSPSATR